MRLQEALLLKRCRNTKKLSASKKEQSNTHKFLTLRHRIEITIRKK